MRYVILTIALFSYAISWCQETAPKPWGAEIRAGVNVNFYYASKAPLKHSFPGIKVFFSTIIGRSLDPNFPVVFGNTISLYGKSLGNDLNHLLDDVQIDFATNITVGVSGSTKVQYPKYMRTFHNTPAYNVMHTHENAFFTGMTVIFNNHGRHQVINSFLLTVGNFSMNYFNDGGPLVGILPLSDKFDRYWTGGAEIMTHSRKGYNTVEFGFDQFTGYAPLVYEFSSMLGLNVPEYKALYGKKGMSPGVNSAAYHLRVGINESTWVDVGVLGSLQGVGKDGKLKYYSAQDIIHILRGDALHPNYDTNKFYFGYTYNRFLDSTTFR
jgi:hypothetical protein